MTGDDASELKSRTWMALIWVEPLEPPLSVITWGVAEAVNVPMVYSPRPPEPPVL